MAQVIGSINAINGSFFIKNADGVVSAAKVGDLINSGDIILGSGSNSTSNMLTVALNDNSKLINVIGDNQQLFDETMLGLELNSDTVVKNVELNESLLLDTATNNQPDAQQPNPDATLTLEEIEKLDAAAAGGETTPTDGSSGVLLARLEDRTGAEVDINTDLRDTSTLGTSVAVETAEIIETEQIIETAPLLDAVFSFIGNVTVLEGSGTATISASLNQTPTTPLVITLSNGATITFGTGYVPGTAVVSTPFPIQGDDVYVDGENYTISVSSTTGGGFASVDSSGTAIVTVSDTIDTTTVVVITADVNEDEASVSFNISLDNEPEGAATATVEVTDQDGNVTTHTVNIAADGTGVLTIGTKDSDVYNDSQSLTAKVTAINNGNYEDVDLGSAVTANITDINAIDTTTANITVNITNSTTAVLSVQMSNIPDLTTYNENDKPVVYLKPDSSAILLAIEIGADGKGSINLTPEQVAMFTNQNGSLTVSFDHISGGNYENVIGTTSTDYIPNINTPLIGDNAEITGDTALGTSITGSLNFDFGDDKASTTNPVSITYNGGLGKATPTSLNGITTITANDGTWELVINESTGNYTFTQTSTYTHPEGVDSVSGLVTVTITDADGDSTSTQLELKITDDTPTVTVDDLYVNRTAGLTEGGAINFDSGADSISLINFINNDGKLTWVGMDDNKFDFSIKLANTDSITYEATYMDVNNVKQTYFEVTINSDGTYDFNLLQPAPTVITSSDDLLGTFTTSTSQATLVSIDSSNFDNLFSVDLSAYTVAKNGTIFSATINASNSSLGVNGDVVQGNLGEVLRFNLVETTTSNVSLDNLKIIADSTAGIKSTDIINLSIKYKNETIPSNVIGTISVLANGNYQITFDIDQSKQLDYIDLIPSKEASLKILGVTLDYTTTTDPSDIPLQFRLEGEDADGDSSIADFNVTLMSGTAGNNIISTGSNDDSISGGDGDDTINSEAGNDHLYGGTGNDILNAGDGNDYLYGGDGNDTLNGGAGNDYLDGGAGADTLNGGTGDDRLVFDANDVIIDGGAGKDTLVLGLDDNIDFSLLNNSVIKNIESIDLSAGNHEIKLSLEDVISMTDITDKTLQIIGDTGDKVELTGGGWTKSAPTVDLPGYDVYTNSGEASYKVLIQTQIVDTTN